MASVAKKDIYTPLSHGDHLMLHCGVQPWTEVSTTNLNDAISEFEARIANSRHWSKEKNEQNIEKLRELNFQKQLLIDYDQKLTTHLWIEAGHPQLTCQPHEKLSMDTHTTGLLHEEAPMAERSMRNRLTYSGATTRTYAESLLWGMRWEGLRSKWFSVYGRWAEAEECLARLDYREREYAGEVKQGC